MKYRVLIIEDDKGIAEAMEQSLAGWSMDSRTVRDFHAVLEEFASYEPHLVLIDIGLPFMDGYH